MEATTMTELLYILIDIVGGILVAFFLAAILFK